MRCIIRHIRSRRRRAEGALRRCAGLKGGGICLRQGGQGRIGGGLGLHRRRIRGPKVRLRRKIRLGRACRRLRMFSIGSVGGCGLNWRGWLGCHWGRRAWFGSLVCVQIQIDLLYRSSFSLLRRDQAGLLCRGRIGL